MNHYPHWIRLRGPWECEPLVRFVEGSHGDVLETGDDLPARRRVTMPAGWSDFGLAEFSGRVRFRRRFGYPGRIDEFERVWLTFTGVVHPLEISLNGTNVGTVTAETATGEFDVTGFLQERNELTADVEKREESSGSWGEVRLEIRRTAYLRDVASAWKGEGANRLLHVTGFVAGHCERPLDLYLLVNGKTADQSLVRPEFRFELTAKWADQPPPATIQIELVDGGVIWYAEQVECPS